MVYFFGLDELLHCLGFKKSASSKSSFCDDIDLKLLGLMNNLRSLSVDTGSISSSLSVSPPSSSSSFLSRLKAVSSIVCTGLALKLAKYWSLKLCWSKVPVANPS